MTTFELRQCKVSDAAALAEGAVDPEVRGREDYVRKWLEFNIARGPAITVLSEGRIMGVWGVRCVRKGIGSAWAVVCLDFKEVFGPDAAWMVRNMIDLTAAEYGFERIRAHSRKGFAASQRLLRHLGFTQLRRETKTHLFYRKEFLATEDTESTESIRLRRINIK